MSSSSSYVMGQFERKVKASLEAVAKILDTTRAPVLADGVPHAYDDKFLLVEHMLNMGLGTHLNSLQALGLNTAQLDVLREWVHQGKAVTLRFTVGEKCDFEKQTQEKVKRGGATHVQEHSIRGRIFETVKSYTEQTITTYHWRYSVDWKIDIYPGTEADKSLVLSQRAGSCAVVTTTGGDKKCPVSIRVREPLQVNMTWLLQQVTLSGVAFRVNRDRSSCRTPRRNEEVDAALEYFGAFARWGNSVSAVFSQTVFPVQRDSTQNLDFGEYHFYVAHAH
jgi:hypothetical protein